MMLEGLTPEDLEHFARAIAQVGFMAGFIGGVFWTLVRDALGYLADLVCTWEEKRLRIAQARHRAQVMAAASAQAAHARACEREGGMGASVQ